MAKFFVISDRVGEVVGCELGLHEAKVAGSAFFPDGDFYVDCVEAPVSAETICRLLGNLGGYAKSTRRVYPKGE